MVGILVSFWDGLFSEAMLVSGRVLSGGFTVSHVCFSLILIPKLTEGAFQFDEGNLYEGFYNAHRIHVWFIYYICLHSVNFYGFSCR